MPLQGFFLFPLQASGSPIMSFRLWRSSKGNVFFFWCVSPWVVKRAFIFLIFSLLCRRVSRDAFRRCGITPATGSAGKVEREKPAGCFTPTSEPKTSRRADRQTQHARCRSLLPPSPPLTIRDNLQPQQRHNSPLRKKRPPGHPLLRPQDMTLAPSTVRIRKMPTAGLPNKIRAGQGWGASGLQPRPGIG